MLGVFVTGALGGVVVVVVFVVPIAIGMVVPIVIGMVDGKQIIEWNLKPKF